MRWSLRLAEFEFEVQHRAGTKIKPVDALSRHVQSVTVNQFPSKDRIREEQKTDRFCNTLEVGGPKAQSEYFYDEEGVIYRRRKNAEHQLLVPKTLATEVIALNHDPILASHTGRKRTLEVLRLRYYWPGMRQDVKYYVSKCDECRGEDKEGNIPHH